MDLNEIQNLIKFVVRSGTVEVNLETKDFKINIKTLAAYPKEEATSHQSVPVSVPAASKETAQPDKTDDNSRYVTINSPMIGTFYRRSSSDKDVFINVGDEIKPGTIVCIIEAMKLFNEIESEISGKVIKALVDNQSAVEYDQPLFLIDSS